MKGSRSHMWVSGSDEMCHAEPRKSVISKNTEMQCSAGKILNEQDLTVSDGVSNFVLEDLRVRSSSCHTLMLIT